MTVDPPPFEPRLLDERGPVTFRALFGALLSRSTAVDTAILRIRLGAVDLTSRELHRVRRLRVLVADVNSQTVENEAYAMALDERKTQNLLTVMGLLKSGVLEIRSSPLGGWSPDFSVFTGDEGIFGLLLGLHWFHHPYPSRGPAWAAQFGAKEASRALGRFSEVWDRAHDIGPAVRRLMEGTTARGLFPGVDTRNRAG